MTDPVLRHARTAWASPRFRLDEEDWDTADGPVRRPVVRHPGSVVILAEPAPGSVLLVRQWRYAVRRWTLEVPAGTRTPGEPAEVTARRELAEEAGLAAERLDELFRFWPCIGLADEEMVVFRATGLGEAPGRPDPGELVARAVVARAELPALVASGAIGDGKTLLALAWWGVPLPLQPSQPPG
jgi:ADP-ribose pyrophosphatase